MDTARTPYELVLHDRPLDTLFGRLSSVFVPSHVTTLEQLSDIAQAYGNLKNDDDHYNKQSAHHHYHDENVGPRFYQQQHLQWRFFYMDTNKLHQEFEKMIIRQQDNTTLFEKNHRSFLRTLESELIKVHDFYLLKLGEIQRRIAYCNNNDSSFIKKQPHKRLSHLEAEMKALPWETQHLVNFVKANHRDLFTIVYKYDHHLSSSSYARHDKQQNVMQNQLFRLVASKSFCEPAQLFALIVSLNALYKFMRSNQLSSQVPSSVDLWSPTHTEDGDDELRQVPNYTSIYVTSTAANSATGATATTTTPPRLTTTLLPPTALPPSPATTSDGEEDEVGEDDHYDSNGETDSLNSENENVNDNNMLSIQQFWVHPDNLTEILLYITKYMDLSESTSFPPAQVDTASRRCVQQNIQRNITTLHLDTPDLEAYNDRIILGEYQGNDNGTKKRREFKSLRMRWYEEDQSDPTITKPVVAMEEKVYQPVHRGNNTLSRNRNLDKSPFRTPDRNDSIDKHHQAQQLKRQKLHHGNKEYTRHRLWLKSKNMDPWLSGHWSLKHLLNKPYCHHRRTSLPDQCNSDECNDSLLREQILQMENDARLKQIKPVMKTMLCRTVFSDHESELIVSIDTEIAIARHTLDKAPTHNRTDSNDYRFYNSSSSEGDDYFDHQPPPPKTRINSNEVYPYPSASPGDMVRFPYAVIKISCPAKSRQKSSWLSDLCTSPLLEPVHNFSTYVHGVAILMQNEVEHLPQWLSKMNMDLSRKAKRGQLLKQQIRTLSLKRSSSFENNLLQLPPTPWSTTSAFYSPTSTNSSSSCISSNNNHNGSTRATTPSSTTTKGKFVSEDDLGAAAAATTTTTTTALPTTAIETRTATIIADERQPLLQKQHQRHSAESYCSFDHPSSSRSNPAQCRDCMTRRQSSSLYNKSNSNSCVSSSDSLFSKYNKNNSNSNSSSNIIERYRDEGGKATVTDRLTRLMCTLWPTLGEITNHEAVRSGAILPVHNNRALKEEEEEQGITSNKSSLMEDQYRFNTLKLLFICVAAAATVAILLYYNLNTTL